MGMSLAKRITAELAEFSVPSRPIAFLTRHLPKLLLLGACMLAGCEEPTVDVSLHGVDYSGHEFSYSIADPADQDRIIGGEHIAPFSAGGTTCCATLPRKWQPGTRIQIRTTRWLKKQPDGSLPEIKEVHLVEVPRYVDGKPGELWVLRMPEGTMSVVSSDFQPDHPKWPGAIKGWPVPSLEYQRERWSLFRKHKEDMVETYISLIDELEQSPHVRTKKAWEHATQYEPLSLKGFSGPNDPSYANALKKDYAEGLKRTKDDLAAFMETMP